MKTRLPPAGAQCFFKADSRDTRKDSTSSEPAPRNCWLPLRYDVFTRPWWKPDLRYLLLLSGQLVKSCPFQHVVELIRPIRAQPVVERPRGDVVLPGGPLDSGATFGFCRSSNLCHELLCYPKTACVLPDVHLLHVREGEKASNWIKRSKSGSRLTGSGHPANLFAGTPTRSDPGGALIRSVRQPRGCSLRVNTLLRLL